MNEGSRVSNFMHNVKVGIIIQMLSPILAFVSRTVFISVLGEQYLGISGLYTNILTVLSLADLGLYTAMIYSLYKPIADKNEIEIIGILNFFKKVYLVVAAAIMVLGLCLVPFLQYIVTGSALELRELRVYFVLYLINSASSYLIVYKTTLLKADQRIYITKIADFVTKILLEVLQIAVLLWTHNYMLFLIMNTGVVLLKNFITSKIADRMYPYLQKQKGEIGPEVKKKIVTNIKATFLYKLSNIIINSTDNILISMLLGVVIVGRYSNYLQIVTIINTFVMLLSESVIASLGNYNASRSDEAKYKLFRSMLLAYFLIGAFCACCFVGMFNDFIRVWVGRFDASYVLPETTVYVITLNFFLTCSMSPLWLFRETAGIFNQVKYSMAISALLNIILSIILGRWIGLPGILLATTIANLCSNYWYEPKVLYKSLFKKPVSAYWKYILKLLSAALVCIVICAVFGKIVAGNLLTAAVKIVLGGSVTAVVFWCVFHKTEEFLFLKERLLTKLQKTKGIKA